MACPGIGLECSISILLNKKYAMENKGAVEMELMNPST